MNDGGMEGPSAFIRPSRRDLFMGFLQVGISGFGGVLPWVRRMVVDQRRWMSTSEFTDLLALCQLLPGPNVGNLAVALGARFHGWTGAAMALLGLFLAPFFIVIGLAAIYQRYQMVPFVQHMFAGLAAAASGLVLANAIRIATPIRSDKLAIVVALGAFMAVVLLRAPLMWVVLILAPIAMAGEYYRRMRRART